MKELVEIIAKSLVDHPEDVEVIETSKDDAIYIELKVAQEDMGKVIGKQGRIAKSIRTVVKAAASKGDKKVIVDIKWWYHVAWKGCHTSMCDHPSIFSDLKSDEFGMYQEKADKVRVLGRIRKDIEWKIYYRLV